MVLQNAINNLITPQAANRVYGVARRQCISAGASSFVTVINTLDCTIAGSASQPIVCTFAVGWDVLGIPIDYVGTFTSSQTFTALTANTTHFFYLERNTITGALTCNKTTIAPIYSQITPTSPVTGQHWFKTFAGYLTSQSGYKMYEWSGSAWVVRQRVFIAEVTTGASAVTSFASYATNRQYQSAWLTVAAGAIVNVNTGLGMLPHEGQYAVSIYARSNASDPISYLSFSSNISSGSDNALNFGMFPFGVPTRNNYPFLVGGGGLYWDGSGYVIGQVMLSVNSIW